MSTCQEVSEKTSMTNLIQSNHTTCVANDETINVEKLVNEFRSAGINIPSRVVDKLLSASTESDKPPLQLRKILGNPTPV